MRSMLTRLGAVAALAALGTAGFIAAPVAASAHTQTIRFTGGFGTAHLGTTSGFCPRLGIGASSYSLTYTYVTNTETIYPTTPSFTFFLSEGPTCTTSTEGSAGAQVTVQVTQTSKHGVFTLTGTAVVYHNTTFPTTEPVTVSFQETSRSGHVVDVRTTTFGAVNLTSVTLFTCTMSLTIGTSTYTTMGTSTGFCTLAKGVGTPGPGVVVT